MDKEAHLSHTRSSRLKLILDGSKMNLQCDGRETGMTKLFFSSDFTELKVEDGLSVIYETNMSNHFCRTTYTSDRQLSCCI